MKAARTAAAACRVYEGEVAAAFDRVHVLELLQGVLSGRASARGGHDGNAVVEHPLISRKDGSARNVQRVVDVDELDRPTLSAQECEHLVVLNRVLRRVGCLLAPLHELRWAHHETAVAPPVMHEPQHVLVLESRRHMRRSSKRRIRSNEGPERRRATAAARMRRGGRCWCHGCCCDACLRGGAERRRVVVSGERVARLHARSPKNFWKPLTLDPSPLCTDSSVLYNSTQVQCTSSRVITSPNSSSGPMKCFFGLDVYWLLADVLWIGCVLEHFG